MQATRESKPWDSHLYFLVSAGCYGKFARVDDHGNALLILRSKAVFIKPDGSSVSQSFLSSKIHSGHIQGNQGWFCADKDLYIFDGKHIHHSHTFSEVVYCGLEGRLAASKTSIYTDQAEYPAPFQQGLQTCKPADGTLDCLDGSGTLWRVSLDGTLKRYSIPGLKAWDEGFQTDFQIKGSWFIGASTQGVFEYNLEQALLDVCRSNPRERSCAVGLGYDQAFWVTGGLGHYLGRVGKDSIQRLKVANLSDDKEDLALAYNRLGGLISICGGYRYRLGASR